jgi:glyoxalase family protein
MKLDGIHHITAITRDARENLDFYAGVLGLRLTGKGVNQDDPTHYHLYYSDEVGSPGSGLTFFEYPDALPGFAGAGMAHRILWRVSGEEALDFWTQRLTDAYVDVARYETSLLFVDPEGLEHELSMYVGPDVPLVPYHPDIPTQLALQGFDGVRVYSRSASESRSFFERLMNADRVGADEWEIRGDARGGTIGFDVALHRHGRQGAGTIHHIAWATSAAEHRHWDDRLRAAGVRTSGVIDRHWFHSIYFREPGGVLFEIADDEPGIVFDQDVGDLGTKLLLPPWLEPRRDQIESGLEPLPNPRLGAEWTKAHERQPRAGRSEMSPPVSVRE